MTNPFEIFLGSSIVEFIGACSKWTVLSIVNLLVKRKPIKFNEISIGRKKEKLQPAFERGMANIFWGWGTLTFLIIIGAIVNKVFY